MSNRIETVELPEGMRIAEYAQNAFLYSPVAELLAEAAATVPTLEGRTVYMVNSTAKGGGVAEMMPRMVGLLRQLGVSVQWLVIKPERSEFFDLTKRIHNLIHGVGEPELSAADRALYDATSRELADELGTKVTSKDIVVIHDPQPLGLGALIEDRVDPISIWRCHIGLDRDTPETRAAWEFLRPWAERYDHSVFSAPEYIPHYLAGKASVIHPAIDPLSHKNRDLTPTKMTGVLCNAGLMPEYAPVVTNAWPHPALRLQPDGRFAPATTLSEIGLLFRPAVTQVSRWDRLKGWGPLLQGFVELKRRVAHDGAELSPRERRRLELTRLVLAGPEPSAVQDDPEAQAVLDELVATCLALPEEVRADVALLLLPMQSTKHNALMVNVLQRVSSIVVQNSIQEGFGLVATEAMWKRTPVLASRACGLRQQIRDGVDGYLVEDPNDPEVLADALLDVLNEQAERATYGRNAQRRVHNEFLVFRQLRNWLQLLSSLVSGARPRHSRNGTRARH
jgi:trehalose synthase